MYNKSFFVFILLTVFSISFSSAQRVQAAYLSEDGTYSTENLRDFPIQASSRMDYQLLENFPFGTLAHATFKNTRNVTLADLNGDDVQEIVFCANETLFAVNGNGGVLWSAPIIGTSPYPPAIRDMDNDGNVEIAIQTYGVGPSVGNVYLFDNEGNVMPNFPFNSDNHFFLNAVTISPIPGEFGDMYLFACERVSGTEGRIHMLTMDGTSYSDNFPVTIGGTPAVTPTITMSGSGEPIIIACSTTEMYLINFEGEFVNGSPFAADNDKFSYQSPLSVNVHEGEDRYIIGSKHGDNSKNYVIDEFGNPTGEWPHADDQWTYAPPSFWENQSTYRTEIFFNRPFVNEDEEGPILLGFDSFGEPLPNFPIMGNAGSEGLVTIGDIDGDGDQELVSPSKITVGGQGMINAYHIESGELVDGFPLFVPGFTFLNGAYLGDVNGDGKLDLTALSYQLKFNTASPDSTFISVFDLEVDYSESSYPFNGYKGGNDHVGAFFNSFLSTQSLPTFPLSIAPNPANSVITILADVEIVDQAYSIIDMQGKVILSGSLDNGKVNVSELPSGQYQVRIIDDEKIYMNSFMKID